MTEPPTELLTQLEDFGRRLRRRTDEFRANGHFADSHRRFVGRIESTNAGLQARVESALRSGGAWEFVKSELWRDYRALMNDLALLEERLDGEAMKKI